MGAFAVVELDPLSDASLCLCPGFPGMQVNTFILQGSPQSLNEDVVKEPALAIHRDAHAQSAQPVCPGKGRELTALVGVYDLRRAEAVDGLVQCLDAEVGLKCV